MQTTEFENNFSEGYKRRDLLISQLHKQLFRLLYLKRCLQQYIFWLFLWGITVIVLRVAHWVPWSSLFWGALGLAVVPVVAFFFVRKQMPDRKNLGVFLDQDNDAGGLIAASFEVNTDPWMASLPPLKLRKIKWEGKKTYLATLFATLFLLFAIFLLNSTIIAEHRSKLDIDDQVKALEGQIETLQEERILQVEMAEMLKSNLSFIQKEAEGLGPVKTLDALKHLGDQLRQKGEDAAQAALQETERLTQADALTEEVKKFVESLSPEDAQKLTNGLMEVLSDLFGDNEELFEQIKEQLENQNSDDGSEQSKDSEGQDSQREGEKQKLDGESGKKESQKMLWELTPEQLEQLQQKMKNCKEINREMLEKLNRRGMINPEMLKKFSQLEQKVDEKKLDDLLNELDQCEGCQGLCEGEGDGLPGRGGISRGRGDAPLTFEDQETDPEGTEFQSKVLSPPSEEELLDSLRLGSSRSAPEVNPEGNTADGGGTIQNIHGATGNAHGQTILPQHRGPIERYFERK